MNEMVYCRACGKQLHETAPTCPHCGAPQFAGKDAKNKTTAALLALFLGGLGIHRFYLGKWWGLFYLLLCWTGIPGLIALIEGIVFACTDQQKWDAKYNKGLSSTASNATTAIIVVAAVFGSIAIIGVLAAIAIPAYQDYVVRAKVYEAVNAISAATPTISEFIESNHQIPSSLQAAGYNKQLPGFIAGVAINQRTGEILVTLASPPSVGGKTFSLVPRVTEPHHISWQCTSNSLPQRNLPQNCRN